VHQFFGNSKNFGYDVFIGANAYFKSINDNGGVYGREIKLIHKDDRYEPKLLSKMPMSLSTKIKILHFLE